MPRTGFSAGVALPAVRHTEFVAGRELLQFILGLLSRLDGFDDRGDVRVVTATNSIEALDPVLIRPGRIDRKIEFSPSDVTATLKTDRTAKTQLARPVSLYEVAVGINGVDVEAAYSEAGTLDIGAARVQVTRVVRDAARLDAGRGHGRGCEDAVRAAHNQRHSSVSTATKSRGGQGPMLQGEHLPQDKPELHDTA